MSINLGKVQSDYQFVYDQLKNLQSHRIKSVAPITESVTSIVNFIFELKPKLSYFSLHKLFYLIEIQSKKKFGQRLTNAYIIRQKDGPYCTDLHYKRIQKSMPDLKVKTENGMLILERKNKIPDTNLFGDNHYLPSEAKDLISEVMSKYASYDEAKLKTSVYLTSPMRDLLSKESQGLQNLYNTAVDFSDV